MKTLIVACPHCHAKNRIPDVKSDVPANCGRCHQPLSRTDTQDQSKETVTLRCSQCRARNRVPMTKLHSGAKCGKCGTTLQHENVFDGHPLAVDETNFERLVMRSPLPVLLYGWAPWCGVCSSTTPMVAELASETKGKVRVAKLNIDQNPSLASRYHIMGVPAFFIIDGGEIKIHFPGAVPKHELMMKLSNYLL